MKLPHLSSHLSLQSPVKYPGQPFFISLDRWGNWGLKLRSDLLTDPEPPSLRFWTSISALVSFQGIFLKKCKLKVVFLFPNETIYLISPPISPLIPLSLFHCSCQNFRLLAIPILIWLMRLENYLITFSSFYCNIEIKEACKDQNNKTVSDISSLRKAW